MNVAGTVIGGAVTLVMFAAAGALAYKAKRDRDKWNEQMNQVLLPSNSPYLYGLYGSQHHD